MGGVAVHVKKDPTCRAALIRCEVCEACRWARQDACIYNGPFEGYRIEERSP